MTKEDIIRMAREVGLVRAGDGWTEPARWGLTQIEHFAKLVAAAERDRNTKLLYQMNERATALHSYYKHAAIEINRKARSQS